METWFWCLAGTWCVVTFLLGRALGTRLALRWANKVLKKQPQLTGDVSKWQRALEALAEEVRVTGEQNRERFHFDSTQIAKAMAELSASMQELHDRVEIVQKDVLARPGLTGCEDPCETEVRGWPCSGRAQESDLPDSAPKA